MWSNYFKLTIRGFINNPGQSLINLASLAIGLTITICLLAYYHTRHIVTNRALLYSEQLYYADAQTYLGLKLPTMMVEYAHMVNDLSDNSIEIAHVHSESRQNVRANNIELWSEHYIVSENFFQLFDMKFAHGVRDQAFSEDSSVVITDELSIKLFGTIDSMGKTIESGSAFNTYHPLKVTGIIEKKAIKTHLSADVYVPLKYAAPIMGSAYAFTQSPNSMEAIYLKIANPGQMATAREALIQLLKKWNPNVDLESEQTQTILRKGLRPVHNLRLDAPPESEMFMLNDVHKATAKVTTRAITKGAFWIALFALCITLLNYIALTVARQSKRQREMALRRCHGATMSGLTSQLIAEALVWTVVALSITLIWLPLTLPAFGALLGTDLSISELVSIKNTGTLVAGLLAISVFIGLVPAAILKHRSVSLMADSTFNQRTLKVLTACQFALATVLICGATTLTGQYNSIQSHDYGFNPETIVVPQVNRLNDDYESRLQFIQEASTSHLIEGAALSQSSFYRHMVVPQVYNANVRPEQQLH